MQRTITFPSGIFTQTQPCHSKEKCKKSRKEQGTMWRKFPYTVNHSACEGTVITSCSVSFPSVWACAVCGTCVSQLLSCMFVLRRVPCTSEPSRAAGMILFTGGRRSRHKPQPHSRKIYIRAVPLCLSTARMYCYDIYFLRVAVMKI